MANIEITKEEADQIGWEESERFEVVEPGRWISDGKYDKVVSIVKDVETSLFYQFSSRRCGSYFTEYEYYPSTILVQVEKKEKVIFVWEPVKEL